MTTRITDVRTVAIPVGDQDRAVEFYTRTLEFEKRLEAPFGGGGGRWIEVAPAGSPVSIALVPPGPSFSTGVDTGIRLTTEDAEADHATLESRGVEAGGILRIDGVPPMFSFRDPDGNTLYIVERMQRPA